MGSIVDIAIEDTGDEDGTVEIVLVSASPLCVVGVQVDTKILGPSGEPTLRPINESSGLTLTADRASARILAIGALAILHTLDTSDARLIEITPPPESRMRRKFLKPWVRTDLPRIVLMNLTEARAYGHRVDRDGTHASPIPHRRKGNWATLRASRYGERVGERVWRKEAWIGDREWMFEGSHYRVVNSEVSAVAAAGKSA
jgi:hypothetical protein